MLRGPGGVSSCCGKAGQLVESGWGAGPLFKELRMRPCREEWMVMMVSGRAGRSVGCEEGVVVVLALVFLWQQACKAGGRELGGASAVEAGQSCSRHQGRHFLWGERDRKEGQAESEISLIIHVQRKLPGLFSLSFIFRRRL